ncbi:MAG: fructose-1,6-bisphosphatase [Clostridia bacterium]|nr:fructose-1,6-bisphosphatase [Clostridia bacterium]
MSDLIFSEETRKFLSLLAKDYPSVTAATGRIVNLQALLKLPKGTEHFMSDLHGESEAFVHILNSSSGVIREKADAILGPRVPEEERAEFATMVYYPEQKLPLLKAKQRDLGTWYRLTLMRLIDLCRLVSSKHTRAYVRAALPANTAYIIDELLHAHFEDHDKNLYYGQIIDSILDGGAADAYIVSLCQVIKRLAVSRLHIVGDLFDRGPRPDVILDELMARTAVDIQWGNHDVVWLGAAAGSPVCVATVLRNSLSYNNYEMLEEGYGINLRRLALFADATYADSDLTLFMPKQNRPDELYSESHQLRTARMTKAITVVMMKLEAAVIARHPEYEMVNRALLNHINFERRTVTIDGAEYPLSTADLPTVDPRDPAHLTDDEYYLISTLTSSFMHSEKLQRHAQYLLSKGSLYHIANGNLLYHGCIPMDDEGRFATVSATGEPLSGQPLMDACDRLARRGYFAPEGSTERESGRDFLWYLWCGPQSPLFGRARMTTFERLFVADAATHAEPKNPYYRIYSHEAVAKRILTEFGLDPDTGHIINGHVPVKATEGEDPIKANGRLIVIDGGFCRAYQRTTGIAGYTLVFNSRKLSLRIHDSFESAERAVHTNTDIASRATDVEIMPHRLLIEDTDEGAQYRKQIADLKQLVLAYQKGLLKEHA